MYKTLPLLLLLTACTGSGIGANHANHSGVTPADDNRVKDCTFLGEVVGFSSLWFAGKAHEQSRAKAFEQAGALGATHLVFTNTLIDESLASTQFYGKAYRCDK